VKQSTTANPGAISEATNANIYGLTAWAKDPAKGRTLEAGIQQAFTAGASQDFTREIGYTHPQVLGPSINLGTPDPSTKDTQFVTKALPTGQGTRPPPVAPCTNVAQGSYCSTWGEGPRTNQTTLTINNQADIVHFGFALPIGTTVTAVAGGCTFSGNHISCPNPIPTGQILSIVISTEQPIPRGTTGTVTTYDSNGNPTSGPVHLQY
jgi:hypothetical protein